MRKHFPYPVSLDEAQDPTRFFNVPVGIAEVVLKENLFSPFQLFMYFKTVSKAGHLRITNRTIRMAAVDLEINQRTVKRNLQKLLDRNWIGRFHSGTYILRSFDKLRRMEGAWTRSAAIFDRERHLKNLKEFIIAACLGRLVSRQQAKLWRARLPGERRGAPNERKQPLPTSYPIACVAMSQIYGISTGTAFKWKAAAHITGFITVEKVLRPVIIDNLPEWKRVFPDDAHRVIFRKGQYFLQYPDRVTCNLKMCRRRTLKKLDKK